MDIYAVIGNPVAHSLSPKIHAAFAEQTNENLEYISIEAPLDSFEATLHELQRNSGKGASITMPFKAQALALASDCSEAAHLAQAANTLVMHDDQSIYAHNTDGSGFIKDLTLNQKFLVQQKKILLLGAGGAAHGIIGPLVNLVPQQIIIANRNKTKAVALAELPPLHGNISGIGLDEIPHTAFDLIINATSASAQGQELTLPAEIIGDDSCCYDLMYADTLTPFLQWAKEHGATHCIDGIGMLVEQAAEAFFLWRNVRPETEELIANLKK